MRIWYQKWTQNYTKDTCNDIYHKHVHHMCTIMVSNKWVQPSCVMQICTNRYVQQRYTEKINNKCVHVDQRCLLQMCANMHRPAYHNVYYHVCTKLVQQKWAIKMYHNFAIYWCTCIFLQNNDIEPTRNLF